MAKQIESQVSAWKKVVETVEMEDNGDILMPLKRVSVKFAAKALAWANRAPQADERVERTYGVRSETGEREEFVRSRRPLPVKPSSPEFYIQATQAVDRLINGEAFNG